MTLTLFPFRIHWLREHVPELSNDTWPKVSILIKSLIKESPGLFAKQCLTTLYELMSVPSDWKITFDPMQISSLVAFALHFTEDLETFQKQQNTNFLTELFVYIVEEGWSQRLLEFLKSVFYASHETQALEWAHMLYFMISVLKEKTTTGFLREVDALTSHRSLIVRKQMVTYLGLITPLLESSIRDSEIVAIFERLANDTIWEVRKMCADEMYNICEHVKQRKDAFVTIFVNLATDESRWVCEAAFKNLGRLIYTFRDNRVPETLLEYYKKVCLDPEDNMFIDAGYNFFSAYNFPAVLLTVGREGWEDLHEVYDHLIRDEDFNVRRTLAFSIHEVAKVIGEDLTETDLLEYFDSLIKDLEDVRIGAIEHMSEFMSRVPTTRRALMLSFLKDIPQEPNWRIRRSIAKQLSGLTALYPLQDVIETFIPLYEKLFKDPVYQVRKSLLSVSATFLKLLPFEDPSFQDFIHILQEQATSKDCSRRQWFAALCSSLCDTLDMQPFDTFFWPKLLELSKDPVPNVRMKVAEVMKKLSDHALFKERPEVSHAIEMLKSDSDPDVVNKCT